MTCIVAIEHAGSVWMGGDSIAIDGGEDAFTMAEPKVFARGGILIGSTGGIRGSQVLRHLLRLPRRSPRISDEAWICGPFVDSVRDAFRKAGAMTNKDGVEGGECFLVGYRGKVWDVEGQGFGAVRSARGFAAIGCGGKYALGALVAAPHGGPSDRILRALEASAALNAGVRGPFTILKGATVGKQA